MDRLGEIVTACSADCASKDALESNLLVRRAKQVRKSIVKSLASS